MELLGGTDVRGAVVGGRAEDDPARRPELGDWAVHAFTRAFSRKRRRSGWLGGGGLSNCRSLV